MTAELIKTTGITLNGDKITAVNARDLWKFLESKQEFANWIKDRIRKYGFKEGLDFTVDKIINGENKGRFAANEYFISLDMAKELAMVENNERGRQARQYFIEVEKRRPFFYFPEKFSPPQTGEFFESQKEEHFHFSKNSPRVY